MQQKDWRRHCGSRPGNSVIDSGAYGQLPVMQEVRCEAERLKIKLLVLPIAEAIKVLEEDLKDTNAIIHVTC